MPNYSREQKDDLGFRCEQKVGGRVDGRPYNEYKAWYRSLPVAGRRGYRAGLAGELEGLGESRAYAECYAVWLLEEYALLFLLHFFSSAFSICPCIHS